jgi:ribosomal-protein-alanine N-acetyltransferase
LLGRSDADRIVGYVGFRVQSGRGHLTTIALLPDWRGHGLGEFLLVVALERMASADVDRVTLEMRPSNDVAYRLYRKHDFEVVEYRRGYYRDGEDAWVMAAELADEAGRRGLEKRGRKIRRRLDGQDVDVGQTDCEGL